VVCKENFIDSLLQMPYSNLYPAQWHRISGTSGLSHMRHQINLDVAAVACRRYSAKYRRGSRWQCDDVGHACKVAKQRNPDNRSVLLITTNPATNALVNWIQHENEDPTHHVTWLAIVNWNSFRIACFRFRFTYPWD
jgi:hypothetical protein